MTTPRSRRLLALVAIVAAGVLAPARTAHAHAELVGSEPPADAVLTAAPDAVQLTFTEAVETALGSVVVVDAGGTRQATGSPRHPAGRDDQVEVSVPPLADGTYVVAWRVTSADGHPVQGSYLFSVGRRTALAPGAGDALAGAAASRTVGVLLGVARFATFAGFLLLAGSLAYVTVFARAAPGTSALAASGAVVLAVGSAAGLALQGGYATGASLGASLRTEVWRATVQTEFGRQALLRIALAALGAALGLVLSQAHRVWWQAFAVAVGPLVALTIARSGHANAGRWPTVALVTDVVHLVALAWWLGGLAVLGATALRATDGREAVARFSPFALGCVALAVVSGGVQAWRQLGSVDGLSTPYGRLLLAKLAPVVALVFAASLARRALRSWTADLRTPALLRRAVLGELAFGLVVLGVTSVLVATPPGRDRTAAPFVTSLVSPQGARAELSIEPAAPGPVTVHLYATPPGGSLERAAEARLTMSLPTRGIADLAVPLALAGNNHFASTGASIPLAGAWQATITVRFGEFDSYTFTTTVAVR